MGNKQSKRRDSKHMESSKPSLEKENSRTMDYCVLVHICQARKVKKMDVLSQSDPYIRVQIDGQESKTRVINNTAKPVWNASFKFVFDTKPSKVTLLCFDKDSTNDDFIGKCEIEIKQWDAPSEFQWIPLADKEKKEDNNGEVQVKIEAMTMSQQVRTQIAHYDFTHLLEVHIHEARNLRSMDTLSKNDSFVEVTWGSQKFRTSVINSQDPVWDQSVFFWVNEPVQRNHTVQLSVFDEDLKSNDCVGTAYVPINGFFEFDEKGQTIESALVRGNLRDNELGNVNSASPDSPRRGTLRVTFRLMPKDKVFDDFFQKLLEEFDANREGSLSREEVETMLEALGVSMTQDEFETFWTASDTDGSGNITPDEARVFMRALMFVNAEAANATIGFLQGGLEKVRKNLMVGVTEKGNGKQTEIKVFDRQSGLIVTENIPAYIKVALKSLFSSKTGKYITGSRRAVEIMYTMSVKQGKRYDSPNSAKDIAAFIKLHNLNINEVEKPVAEFKTFNEFFARALVPDARPIAFPADPTVAVSPADCRMMVFPDVNDATRLWVKGAHFTVENVFGPVAERLANRYKDGSFVIARLAPQDYHRWHLPVEGTVVNKTKIDGALYSVNPILVNQNVDVFTTNKRYVCEIETKEFGLVILIAVGATMVGSVNFIADDNILHKKGTPHGFFAFGGSTVLLFFERGRIQFDNDLVNNSSNKLETLIRVNSSMGKALMQN